MTRSKPKRKARKVVRRKVWIFLRKDKSVSPMLATAQPRPGAEWSEEYGNGYIPATLTYVVPQRRTRR